MRNKYPGTCYRCGQFCDKGQGHFERHKGTFRVQHAECAIKFKELKGGQPMRVCNSIQELLDEELSQMWEGLDYEGLSVESTKEWCR